MFYFAFQKCCYLNICIPFLSFSAGDPSVECKCYRFVPDCTNSLFDKWRVSFHRVIRDNFFVRIKNKLVKQCILGLKFLS